MPFFLRALSSIKSNPKRLGASSSAPRVFHSRYSQLRVCDVRSKPGPLTRPLPANLGPWPGPAGADHARAPGSTVTVPALVSLGPRGKRVRPGPPHCHRRPGWKIGAAGPRSGVNAEHPARAIRLKMASRAAPPGPASRITTRRLGGHQSPSCLSRAVRMGAQASMRLFGGCWA